MGEGRGAMSVKSTVRRRHEQSVGARRGCNFNMLFVSVLAIAGREFDLNFASASEALA